jgi:hypothetical protein
MVLAHVSAHHDYHIDRILDLCRRHRVWDAAAHLLENTGDVQTALKLIVDQVCVFVLQVWSVVDCTLTVLCAG